MSTNILDITATSRAFWLGASVGASFDSYGDLTPIGPRMDVRWRVPTSINVQGRRHVQGGPLSWTAEVWAFDPRVLRDVPWSKVNEDAEALAVSLDRALARGARGLAAVEARKTAASLRKQPDVLQALAITSMLTEAAHVVVVKVASPEPIIERQRTTRGLVAFLIDKDGKVVRNSKSVYVAQHPEDALSADDLFQVGTALGISVHPVLMALDALNAGSASVKDGKLVLARPAAPLSASA